MRFIAMRFMQMIGGAWFAGTLVAFGLGEMRAFWALLIITNMYWAGALMCSQHGEVDQ